MPQFQAESADLETEGPRVTVTFGLTRAATQLLTSAGQPVPPPVAATAMLDTGASGTAVRTGLLGPLGLNPVGLQDVLTPTTGATPVKYVTYAVLMAMPNGSINLTVVETELAGQGIDALIGRDVLKHGLFIYQGHSSQFTLSF
jgi:hypothetical protein